MAVPTRKTSEQDLSAWNAQLRASPVWNQWMQQRGKLNNGRPIGLSDREQADLERHLAANGMPVPSGMHIDQAGNLNQKNTLKRNVAIAAGVAAGGYFAAPAIAGALGASGTAGGTFGGVVAGGSSTAAKAGLTSGASMGSWLGPLLQYGVPVAGGLIAGKMQASAESDAARIQADYLNRALEAAKEDQQYRRTFDEEERGYSRGQRADYLGRLQPYGNAGNAATSRAEGLLTNSRYRPELNGASNAGQPGGQMVRLKAPDGSGESDVPASMADYYMKRGAQRV